MRHLPGLFMMVSVSECWIHVPARSGPAYWTVGCMFRFLVSSEQAGGSYTTMEITVPPGEGANPHSHPDEEEQFYVIEGELSYEIAGETVAVAAGDFVHIPRGVLHGFRNGDPRAYVEELRGEAAGRRSALREAEERAERYGRELFAARIAATGRLADPTDLTYDPAFLDDQEALGAALDDLVARKPHLASRRPTGDVDQGARESAEGVSLAGLLRAGAG